MIASTYQAGALIELGVVVLGLAVVARAAHRFSFSPVPAYLLAGLAVVRDHRQIPRRPRAARQPRERHGACRS